MKYDKLFKELNTVDLSITVSAALSSDDFWDEIAIGSEFSNDYSVGDAFTLTLN